ncbi:DUF5681 domain-containing protein [Novosphingobium aquae]|uniref:DUF5681 domain-containing protein n=1 Tax=Novosphingobium aquae TaxID=3133435 RepID=A0ABU8S5X1_9SPHN
MTKGKGGNPSQVGYGKPPKASQWKPGESGNPSGKSKKPKPKSIAKAFSDELASPVKITQNGKTVTMQMVEVIAKKVAHKMVDADIDKLAPLLRVLKSIGVFSFAEPPEDDPDDRGLFTEEHRRLLEIARRDAGME